MCETVETREAMMMVVLPLRFSLILFRIVSSVLTSTADTESSMIMIGAFFMLIKPLPRLMSCVSVPARIRAGMPASPAPRSQPENPALPLTAAGSDRLLYEGSVQYESLFLPFARLLLSTFLPSSVFILFLKPCSF